MTIALLWFRRDFRVRDNTALHAACADHDAVAGLFVIDPRWFGNPAAMGAFQATYWLESLRALSTDLADRGIPLLLRRSNDPSAAVLEVARELDADTICYNKDYEPAQVAQDMHLDRRAQAAGIRVRACKDQVVWEEQEILTQSGGIYSVFTPYKRAWLARTDADPAAAAPHGLPRKPPHPLGRKPDEIPCADDLGYHVVTLTVAPGERAAATQLHQFLDHTLEHYHISRNIPADPRGTSRLSAALSAGTISVRQILAAVRDHLHNVSDGQSHGLQSLGSGPDAFIGELVWRDFYKMILFARPDTVTQPFVESYADLKWADDEKLFAAWQAGQTGFPIVDAGLRELAATGHMHNRLRMITAMFLTKDLDCHWKLGERHFMQHLVDYDQAANVGGWQWSASTGTDAAPYFRIMNPTLQAKKIDPDGEYVKRWVPELSRVPAKFVHEPWHMPADLQRELACELGRDYPHPIIDHAQARQHAIAKYKQHK